MMMIEGVTVRSRGRYRIGDYHLMHDPPPIPIRCCDWGWWHDDYDGAPDAGPQDDGHAPTFHDALTQALGDDA